MDFFAEGYFELFGIQVKRKNIRFFATEFGFDENQTVALLGAHTLGQVGKTDKRMEIWVCLLGQEGKKRNSSMSWHSISHLLSFSGG